MNLLLNTKFELMEGIHMMESSTVLDPDSSTWISLEDQDLLTLQEIYMHPRVLGV